MENYKFYTIVDDGGQGVQVSRYDDIEHINTIDYIRFQPKESAYFNLEVINTRLESGAYGVMEDVELPLRVVKLSVSVDFEEVN